MDASLAANFFALLLLGGTVGLLVGILHAPTRTLLASQALGLAAMIAVGSTLGSLYFSEVAGFVPCELCWYQRIAMYPLAVLLGIAWFSKDPGVFRYVIALAGSGLVIAGYHVQLQLFPDQTTFCGLANPCTASPTKAFGWMTIPHMSAISFALISTLAVLAFINRGHTPPLETS